MEPIGSFLSVIEMSNTYSKNKLLSIVLPVFNEEGNIKELYQRLKNILVSIDYAYELIFVDDGSQDHHHAGIDQQRRFMRTEPDQMLVVAMGDLQMELSAVPDHDSACPQPRRRTD